MNWVSALLGAGASILSGFLGSNAATSASQSQAAAQDKATNLQAATIAQGRADAAPWLSAGKTALGALMGQLGIGGQTQAQSTAQFEATPGYQFTQQQGNKATVNQMKALGLGASGAALKSLSRYNSNLADQTYNQYLDRLSGISTGGQTAEANNANTTASATSGLASSIADQGAAQASGYVGSANSWINALGNGATNIGKALGSSGNWNFLGA